jgi:hypothetical protein
MFDVSGRYVNFDLTTNLSPGSTPCLSLATAPSSGASQTVFLQILQLVVYNSMKPWNTLLPMSDAQKVVEAVKRYELKCMGVLTQHLEAGTSMSKTSISKYANVLISVHVSYQN